MERKKSVLSILTSGVEEAAQLGAGFVREFAVETGRLRVEFERDFRFSGCVRAGLAGFVDFNGRRRGSGATRRGFRPRVCGRDGAFARRVQARFPLFGLRSRRSCRFY